MGDGAVFWLWLVLGLFLLMGAASMVAVWVSHRYRDDEEEET